MTNPDKQIEQLKLLEYYQANPVEYMVDCLDVERRYVWSKMEEMCNAVRDHDFVAVKAGNSLSKSFTLGRLALWFLYCFPPSTVITTAPSNIQVEEILWREIREAHAASKAKLGGECLKTKLELGEKWFATGFATKPDTVTQHATRLQGFHNEHVLIILDEAAGVDPLIWEAIDRLMSGEGMVKLVAVGNPTTSQGNFVDCFRDKKFHKITVSVFDTPNYKEGKEVIPGLSGRKFVDLVKNKYGEGSNQWKSMITGEIPSEDTNSLISLADIEKAETRKMVDHNFRMIKKFIVWDVADGGEDLHTIKAYENTTEIESIELRNKTVEQAEPYVWRLLRQVRGNTIIWDNDGIGRVAGKLLEQSKDDGTTLLPFEGSSRAVNDPSTFYNKKDEAHWDMRRYFSEGMIKINYDPDLHEELASIRIDDSVDKPKNKMQYISVEPKKLLKKRLNRSPDKSDNVMMMCGMFDEIPHVMKYSRYSEVEQFENDYYFTPETC